MKQKIKEFSKKYLVGFIIGSILFGTLGVYAVTYFPGLNTTYDNSDSGMTSTNVQDALDELYNVCVPPAGETIIEEAGLEKDPYECRYFFTGANPNNYVTFNGEKSGWRIISVECDGTIKIIRNESIGDYAWDTSNSNGWKVASLNTYLNGTYLNSLSSESKDQIIVHDFSIGGVTNTYADLEDQVNYENSEKWNGKLALPTVSEYLRTNSNTNCKTMRSNDSNGICKNTTWMYINDNWSILARNSASSFFVYYVTSIGSLINTLRADYENNATRPTLYLNANIKLLGSGTSTDPYTIS